MVYKVHIQETRIGFIYQIDCYIELCANSFVSLRQFITVKTHDSSVALRKPCRKTSL